MTQPSINIRKTRQNRRLALIGIIGAALALTVFLVAMALREQIVFFKTPTDIVTEGLAPNERVRIGGLVKDGSVIREGQTINFVVTDTANDLPVSYTGIIPDLFREGQGVVAEGTVNAAGLFTADTVLAKHDENYIPKEVSEALKQQGVWQGETPEG
jgi:cytochrome c-type biogenesis protein CcmE